VNLKIANVVKYARGSAPFAGIPIRHANVTLAISQPWPLGLAKTCFVEGYSKDSMRMHCAAAGDPDTNDGTLYLIDATFDKPVYPDGVYGVICRLHSVTHATCTAGDTK